jgi:RNA polymerase sigma-70 factor (ECF subfamily)
MTEAEIQALTSDGGPPLPELFRLYARKGARYAFALLGNQQDSEDVVQEAFCRLLGPVRRGEVRAELGGFRALFFRTLRNLALDVLRKRKTRRSLYLDDVGEVAARNVPSDDGDLLETLAALRCELPSHEREALDLRVSGGLGYDEIASVLGCTRSQVRTWIYRARRRLEEELRRRRLLPCEVNHDGM